MTKAPGDHPKRGVVAPPVAAEGWWWRGEMRSRISTWLLTVWRHRWLSLGTTWVVCLLGWMAIAFWPNTYMSSAVVYADSEILVDASTSTSAPVDASTSTSAPVDASTSTSANADQNPLALMKGMLLTPASLEKVRESVGLDDQHARTLRDDIVVRATAPPIFVVAYDHGDPAVAYGVLDTLFSAYRERIEQAAAAELAGLDDQIKDHEDKIAAIDAELAERRQAQTTPTNSRDAEIALIHEEVASLQREIDSTKAARDDLTEKLAAAVQNQQADATVPANQTTDGERSEKLAALRAELAKLRERYADTHPYVVAVTDAIDALNAEEGGEQEGAVDANVSGRGGPGLSAEYQELQRQHAEHVARLSALNNDLATKNEEIDRLEALTATASSVEAELSALETEKSDLQRALEGLVAERGAIGRQTGDDVEQASFRLINAPNLPTKPTGPSRLLCLALVLLGGIAAGVAAAVFRNRYKGVFESAWQLRKRFDVGVLGTIAAVLTPEERKKLGYARMAFGLGCVALIGAFGGLAVVESMNLLAPLGN